jgi:hypothetical protein
MTRQISFAALLLLLGIRFFNPFVPSPPLGRGWRGFRGRKGKMALISSYFGVNSPLLSIGFRKSSGSQSENRAFLSNLGTKERPGPIFEFGPALSGGSGALNPSEKQGRHPEGRDLRFQDSENGRLQNRTPVPATLDRECRPTTNPAAVVRPIAKINCRYSL